MIYWVHGDKMQGCSKQCEQDNGAVKFVYAEIINREANQIFRLAQSGKFVFVDRFLKAQTGLLFVRFLDRVKAPS